MNGSLSNKRVICLSIGYLFNDFDSLSFVQLINGCAVYPFVITAIKKLKVSDINRHSLMKIAVNKYIGYINYNKACDMILFNYHKT